MKKKAYVLIIYIVLCIKLLMCGILCSCDTGDYDEPTNTSDNITETNAEDGFKKDNHNNHEEINLMVNGGLEKWVQFTYYDIPQSWYCHNNYNVRKDHDIVCEGRYSVKMQSKESGSTSTIDQCVPVQAGGKIKIRFKYYVEQWKKNGARTYCYFRTRPAEVSNISADELKALYDKATYYIIRGGGYGQTYLPHSLNVWQVFDETIDVPPTANYFVFGINSYYGTTIYVDDCWVIDVTENKTKGITHAIM